MIVVTAPTSAIGSRVLAALLDAGESVRVVARDPARLPPQVRERVEIVRGSHGDRAITGRAFIGADGVFWLVPPNNRGSNILSSYAEFTRPALDAMISSSVARIVGVSALGRGTAVAGAAGLATASLVMDDLIADSGISYRALTMPSFMDNLLRQVPSIRNRGLFFSPISGDRKMPSCATADIAAMAVELLRDPTWRAFDEAPVLGPEDLSFDDMATIMTDVLERTVQFRQIPFETYKTQFVERGMSEAYAQAMVDMARAKDNGLDNAVERTPENTTPTRFRTWCETVLKPALG